MYYVYMLRCVDNSIYTGITTDIKRRMQEHFTKDKLGAKYTKNHTPQKLEKVWETKNRVLASKLEYRIKKLSKLQKEEIIKTENLEQFFLNELELENYNLCDSSKLL